MKETHPFQPFAPIGSKKLILGSFPGKESTQITRENDWFYGAARNQFWKILEIVFGKDLSDKNDKQELFKENKIAITDILLSCERRENNNSDDNLINKYILNLDACGHSFGDILFSLLSNLYSLYLNTIQCKLTNNIPQTRNC
jgi:hypoxanthine-DNA glycosylase